MRERRVTVAYAAALIMMLSAAVVLPQQARAQLGLPLLGSLVVTVTSPAAGSTVSGTRTVTASVSIIGGLLVAGVQFKLDGWNLGAEDTSNEYSISWNTANTSNGWHTLTAVARDTLGVRWTSDPVSVHVFNDTTPPSVTITSPTSGAIIAGVITVSANASDNVGVVGVQFKLDGWNLGAEDTTNWFSVSWDTRTASNGSHTLTAVARDAAGNRTTSAPVMVTVDNAPPTVAITAPAPGAIVFGTTLVHADVSDNIGVVGVQFKVDGANLGPEDTTAPKEVSWDTTQFTNGQHTLTAVARDAAGNQTTSAQVMVTVSNVPPDTTGPTVNITEPAAAAAVSATVMVKADASDNVGVVGVQFFVDTTTPLGDDTAAPYEVSWNTTTVSDGSHTLTAVARDAAGNRTTSTQVMVTVSNAAPPATVTRFEEDSPSMNFTLGWTLDTSRSWSGGGAGVSTTAGATATFTFTGPSVNWIGFRGPQAGIARVSLDGAPAEELDLFSPTEEVRAVVFTRRDLANAAHTLTIEATGLKNAAATDAFVAVDAFDVPGPTVTRVQDSDPSIVYAGNWIQGNTDRAYSGGTAAESITAGATATFTFTGTSISWIGARGPQAGIARVYLDGAFVTEVDLLSPTEEIQAIVFTATGLANVSHTLTIESTGLKNAAATNAWIIVDAFEVTF